MSQDSLCLVRFPDGELRVAYYFGIPGVTVPFLFPLEEASAVLDGGMEPLMERMGQLGATPKPTDVEEVQIWVDNGATLWWEGTASRSAGWIVSGSDPFGAFKEEGIVSGEEPRPVHDGVPDWVPDRWRP